ncbi:maleylacetoacetate isomerase [Alginatibacterium sediminis]|uniref:Maleylacetoacetate isomerase n=1 Tax=Alginatibacterium sediminis TaxID=2164068 RepID=A0A420EHW2_9ALTE|nr:maleylacetoacetate isomerase [Alginatibacterium sediminis]RKF20244.1 maleylacetoacetate isomerase [Alginatibacterium sediminis]
MLTLFSYFRSGASHRVRIALNLKAVDYHIEAVHLLNNSGEHRQQSYTKLNPQQLLPSLVLDDGTVISQSLVIIDYLEHAYPQLRLLPADIKLRARALQIAHCLAMEAQPLQNLRVLQYLEHHQQFDAAQKQDWIQHWMRPALHSVESWLEEWSPEQSKFRFCIAEQVSIADCVLIPQLFAAQRFGIDLNDYPRLAQIFTHCSRLPAFIDAAPENQIDAPVTAEFS